MTRPIDTDTVGSLIANTDNQVTIALAESWLKQVEEIEEYVVLTNALGARLTETANALKGKPPSHVWHDWSDLPKVAAEQVERLKDYERLVQNYSLLAKDFRNLEDQLTSWESKCSDLEREIEELHEERQGAFAARRKANVG